MKRFLQIHDLIWLALIVAMTATAAVLAVLNITHGGIIQ